GSFDLVKPTAPDDSRKIERIIQQDPHRCLGALLRHLGKDQGDLTMGYLTVDDKPAWIFQPKAGIHRELRIVLKM
ncbi:MAG: hypothetical protein ACYTBR_16710, partial [Planctomycetota bacterium]